MEELIKEIKDWAESSHDYLSYEQSYSQGYKDAMTWAKEIVLNMIKEYEIKKM